MCGIAGLAGSIFSKQQMQESILSACHSLHHRGPDQSGFYLSDEIVLGVTRLAIRDRAHGTQPLTRQGVTIVYNGELYNADWLKHDLLKKGYSFQTESDTEVLLNGFIEFGPAIVARLEGMFSFAIWDDHCKTLYLCRDRWGEKPLYFTFGEQFLAFASEIKGLRVWPHLQWNHSLEDIGIFLKNSYLPNPRTGWENIFKLEQGSILTWKQGRITLDRYYSPSTEVVPHTAEELFHLLNVSVKKCAVSDRPVGAFLSGGIDSTTIAFFLSQYQSRVPVFSLHWKETDYSEEHYTDAAAKALGLDHYFVQCDSTFFIDNFESIVSLYDEPFGDESMIPTYCLAKFAKQKVDVVLTGDGADEFFHGYERYFFSGDFEKYLEVFAATSNDTLDLICNRDFPLGKSIFLPHYFQAKPFLDEARIKSWIDIKTYLTDNILMKVDRACMGVSLESRAPFLMPAVTNFALSCSTEQLIGAGLRGKEILRLAMERYLPKTTLERKKMGFGVPLAHWFRSSLKEWVTDRLLNGSLLKTGWFSEQGIKKLIGSYNHPRTIYNLLVLEVWLSEAGSS